MAVDPETGKEFTSSTFPPGRTVLKNNAYGPIQIADNDPEKGILNFALAYSYIAGYKETGVAEESGIIAKIGFKILQKKSTAVKFQDTLSMPGAISGTQLFDWDGEVITGYEVIQPDVLSLGDEPYETPGTDIPISTIRQQLRQSTPSVTPSPEVKPTQTPSACRKFCKSGA